MPFCLFDSFTMRCSSDYDGKDRLSNMAFYTLPSTEREGYLILAESYLLPSMIT